MRRLIAWAAAIAVTWGAAGCAHAPLSGARTAPAAGPDSAAFLTLLAGVPNAACPLPGVATAGQPDSARWSRLASSGVRVVFDLRAAAEPRGHDEAAAVRAAGLAYVELPVTAATLDDATFDRFRSLMREQSGSGVLVHCQSGNRVGAVMIPWLVLDRGWPLERAIAAAEAGGLRTPALKEKAMGYVERTRPSR